MEALQVLWNKEGSDPVEEFLGGGGESAKPSYHSLVEAYPEKTVSWLPS